MCAKNKTPAGKNSSEGVSPLAAAGAAAVGGLAMGSLAASPLVGLALALIWGVQAGVCAAIKKGTE